MTTSVTRRSTFAALSSDGRRVRHGPVRLRTLGADHPEVEAGASLSVAFAFGRRFGTAVERNRARRRLKEAIRDVGGDVRTGVALVSGTRQVLTCPYPDLVEHVRRCLDELERLGGGPSSVEHPWGPDLDNGKSLAPASSASLGPSEVP